MLPLGSIPDVHGIVSNWHHMYDGAVGRDGRFFVCVNRQASEGTSCRGNSFQALSTQYPMSPVGASASPHSLFAVDNSSLQTSPLRERDQTPQYNTQNIVLVEIQQQQYQKYDLLRIQY